MNMNDGLTHGDDGDSHSGDSSSCTNDDSSHTSRLGGNHVNQDGSSTSSFSLAKDDSTKVFRAKIIVFSVSCLFAIGCSTFAFLYMRSNQNEEFEQEFLVYANDLITTVDTEASAAFESALFFSATVTSYALALEARWPNITVPDFELRGSAINTMSKALQITLSPLVAVEDRDQWADYAFAHQNWLDESLLQAEELGIDKYDEGSHSWRQPISRTIQSSNDFMGSDGEEIYVYAPVWQQSPPPHDASIVNLDLLQHPVFRRIYRSMKETGRPAFSEVFDLEYLFKSAVKAEFVHPCSVLTYPIFPDIAQHENGDGMVAFVTMVLQWDKFFYNVLPEGSNGVIVVLSGSCGEDFSYQLNGRQPEFLGYGDKHDPTYDYLKVESDFAKQFYPFKSEGQCAYTLKVYPSDEFKASYSTKEPVGIALFVVLVFVITAFAFAIYDFFVQKRQQKVMDAAKRTNAVVASLFPENVRDRILRGAADEVAEELRKGSNKKGGKPSKMELKAFMSDEDEGAQVGNAFGSKPIADLFPEATVMFADIAGFTAWSSVREPCQVFTLLETVYHAFDEIAKRRRVFKVETIGDCYVAVTGLPEPRKDHAIVMARFARDCLYSMNTLVKQLERTLGPDTGDLTMRIGLHSGPVTAGVLRGDKCRFQLFGDTVNTASRVESSGSANRIHLSQETAECLIAGGKAHWISAREDIVTAKGKGEMKTYWLEFKNTVGSTRSGSTENSNDVDNLRSAKPEEENRSVTNLDARTISLVNWNADVLAKLLKQIIARRKALGHKLSSIIPVADPALKEGTVINEVAEIIHLPEYNAKAAGIEANPDDIELDPHIYDQIQNLVTQFAFSYNSNPFHNFEHASHVTMSVTKLLSRIVAPDLASSDEHTLHDHTYGITSDPLTQFSCVFAALIHDVEHEGVPNAQLVKEESPLADKYNDQSVAEQNSVEKAWTMFMSPDYDDFRSVLCPTLEEMKRCRQLIVNAVMATDIVDKELKNARNARWEKAFSSNHEEEHPRDSVNRKATIVIEHLIQASDVSHTMQHWFIFRKWNERLFHEMFKAYKEGRSAANPGDFWYKGEIGFFDFYIIPLAKKLKECSVFGISSDEYLNYAMKNRKEWEHRGQEVVAEMIQKYESMYAGEQLGSQESVDC